MTLPGQSTRWMVVKPCRTIPGGWRVVHADLTEEKARLWAADYATEHRAMSHRELTDLRMAAIKEAETDA